MDMFPTTLAALGVEIKGDRLALGTNLFSGRNTLLEDMGFDKLEAELSKRSIFYNNNLLGAAYYEIKNDLEN
jgi:phosphoglycerol transferase